MKKLVLLLALLIHPVLIFSQASGGQIKRNSRSALHNKKSSNGKKTIGTTATHTQIIDKGRIIKQLIENMIYVNGGDFYMGSLTEETDFVSSKVTVSSFSIGKYEVTQEEWQAVMGSNPSSFVGSKHPVDMVSWDDCQEFIRRLNALTGKHFRLPTEVEWEFAAKGGNKSRKYKYAGSDRIEDVAWYGYTKSGMTTHEVGLKKPNELGIYDMSGNVFEWCQDNGFPNAALSAPSDSSAKFRKSRGGAWNSDKSCCILTYISNRNRHEGFNCTGFRLAL